MAAQMDNAKIQNLINQEYLGEYPRLVRLTYAFFLFREGKIGRYYTISWWGSRPAGFTQFTFTNGSLVQGCLSVLMMNPQDTAMNVPGAIPLNEWVIVYGLDLPAGKDVYILQNMISDVNPTFEA